MWDETRRLRVHDCLYTPSRFKPSRQDSPKGWYGRCCPMVWGDWWNEYLEKARSMVDGEWRILYRVGDETAWCKDSSSAALSNLLENECAIEHNLVSQLTSEALKFPWMRHSPWSRATALYMPNNIVIWFCWAWASVNKKQREMTWGKKKLTAYHFNTWAGRIDRKASRQEEKFLKKSNATSETGHFKKGCIYQE